MDVHSPKNGIFIGIDPYLPDTTRLRAKSREDLRGASVPFNLPFGKHTKSSKTTIFGWVIINKTKFSNGHVQ